MDSGVVFTKDWVVSLMLDVCNYNPSLDLSSFKILEPSCGEGAFLIPIVQRLCDSLDSYNRNPSIILNSISAFELDPLKVDLTRSKVHQLLIRNGFSDSDSTILVNNWIRVGDFLLSDLHCSFDIVIGNPPYIKSSNIPRDVRSKYVSLLETMTMGTDIFIGFIEKGLKLLKNNGKLCYICADRWMQNAYGRKLRRYILNNHSIDLICRLHEVDAFEKKVDAYPAIVLINNSDVDTLYINCSPSFDADGASNLLFNIQSNTIKDDSSFRMNYTKITDHSGGPWLLADLETTRMISTLNSKYPSLEETGVSIGIGVATGRDEVFITDDLNLAEYDRLMPILCNKDIINKTVPCDPLHWLVNPWNTDGTLVDLDLFPQLKQYFKLNYEKLTSRHIAKKNMNQWYRTIDKVSVDLQKSQKLLFSDLSAHSDPIFDYGQYYPHHNLYWCTSDTWNLKVLGGFLLSSQIESIIEAYGVKMRGETMRFQAQYLRKIHLPSPDAIDKNDQKVLEKAFLNRDRQLATEIVSNVIGV